MKSSKWIGLMSAAVVLSVCPILPAQALNEEFSAEVLSVVGNCYSMNNSGINRGLLEGDIVQEGDSVMVKAGGKLTLALDKDWKNVVTIEENSKLLVDSIYPVSLQMTEGDVYARLGELPKDSTFEVRTPILVATARGTEFRTIYKEGEAEVLNFSDSEVTVYNHDDTGKIMPEHTTLKKFEHTAAASRGQAPETPRLLSDMEQYKGRLAREHIDKGVKSAIAESRVGKIQDVQKANRLWKEVHERKIKDAKADPKGQLSARQADFKQVDAPTPKRASQLYAEEVDQQTTSAKGKAPDAGTRKRIPKRQQPEKKPNPPGPPK